MAAIIAVGYRTNSARATQFRQWATNYLSADEMQELNEIVTMNLDYATRQARWHLVQQLGYVLYELDQDAKKFTYQITPR